MFGLSCFNICDAIQARSFSVLFVLHRFFHISQSYVS
jgi:hypothetical protein